MRRRHTISPVFFVHYQDLDNSSLKRHDSDCNLILRIREYSNTGHANIPTQVMQLFEAMDYAWRVNPGCGVQPGPGIPLERLQLLIAVVKQKEHFSKSSMLNQVDNTLELCLVTS